VVAVAGSVAETDAYTREELPDALQLVNRAVERAEQSYHDEFVRKVERRYRAYRGFAEPVLNSRNTGGKDVEDDWHSDITVPYILHTIEGMIATMLEPRPRFDVEPRPRPGETVDEIVARLERSQTIEETLGYALERDKFAQKQRDFMQQDLIAGISVFKTYWDSETRDVIEATNETVEITDGYGGVVDSFDTLKDKTSKVQIRDDACCEVRDVRDFFWPEQAPSVDKAEWLIDRTYETFDALKRLEAEGVYSKVDKLKESRDTTEFRDVSEREQDLRNVRRNKDLIEVLEYWTPERVITVANRKVVLRDTPNPFWNGRMPFIVCAAMPDAFQIPGISVVDALAQHKEMLWTLQNTRLDSLQMLANVITLIRSDVDDPDAFPWEPMAQWFVEDPGQVSTLPVDPTAANITLQAESLIKGDLQNILGGLPFAGGADSTVQGAGGSTATGMSIITSVAQKMIQARKQQYSWAWARIGELFLGMMGQMIREGRVISQVGPGGIQQLLEVHPLHLQGQFNVTVSVMDESTVRQERQTEAMALMNMAGTFGPMMGLNMKPFMEKVLESYGIQNTEQFFQPPQQAALPPGGTPQGAAGMQAQQNGQAPVGSQGQTNPAAAAAMGQGGPNGLSMAPDQFAQQQLQAVQQMGMGAQG